MTDYERLESAVKWAEVEAEKGPLGGWNQEMWALPMKDLLSLRFPGTDAEAVMASTTEPICESAFCIAGHVAYEAGLVRTDRHGNPSLTTGEQWSAAGRRLLDINIHQADALFDGSNSIEQVRYIAEQIKAGVEEPSRFPEG